VRGPPFALKLSAAGASPAVCSSSYAGNGSDLLIAGSLLRGHLGQVLLGGLGRNLWGGRMSSAFFSLRGYPLILVVKTAQNRPSDDPASHRLAGPSRRPRGALKTECGMRPRLARRAHPVNAPDTGGILPPHRQD